jgi:hypothetical protein
LEGAVQSRQAHRRDRNRCRTANSSYLRGEISRRRFIRALVAAGVSLGAATAYSYLVPQRAAAAGGTYDLSDEADPTSASPPPPPPKPSRATARSGPAITLEASRARRTVRASVSSDEAASFVVSATAGAARLATKSFRLGFAATKTVKLQLQLQLPSGAPSRIAVVARATDSAGLSSRARVGLGH